MSRYRQQLARDRAQLASTPAPKRRQVRAGEEIDVRAGEELELVTEVDGSPMVVAHIRVQKDGKLDIGTEKAWRDAMRVSLR